MKSKSLLACAIALMMILNGCTSSSAVMPMSNGVYTLTKSAPTGFTPLGTIRRAAYEDIREFADSKGKAAQLISVNEVPAGFARWPQVEVRFRLVEESELEVSEGINKKERTSVVHDSMGNPIDIETSSVNNSQEKIYEDLKKLGELRKQGILTEEEFQAEKDKLLRKSK